MPPLTDPGNQDGKGAGLRCISVAGTRHSAWRNDPYKLAAGDSQAPQGKTGMWSRSAALAWLANGPTARWIHVG
jgi:hypothetical protein